MNQEGLVVYSFTGVLEKVKYSANVFQIHRIIETINCYKIEILNSVHEQQ